MQLYAILRRNAWTEAELEVASERSGAELEKRSDEVRQIRSYLLDEGDGRFGTICFYEAVGPEAIQAHADAAQIPADEIIPVLKTVVVRPDPQPVA